jgi:3-oxoacyl-[acyl-carrier protein] reductase
MNPILILIAGAGSGIGLHLSKTLLQKGHELLLLDLNKNSLEQNFQESQTLRILEGDVSKPDTWFAAVEIAKDLGRPISHLFNCAGVIRPGFVTDFELSDIDFHLDINTKGSILGTKIIGAEMKNQEFGHIINISSLAGLAPVSGMSLYTASKFAIRGFSLAAAAEFRNYGVDISVVCPDLVATPMLDLQLDYPEETKLTFSGPRKVLQPEDVTRILLKLMENPKPLVCIPESRGLLAKIAGTWPWIAEMFRAGLERKGEKAIQNMK